MYFKEQASLVFPTAVWTGGSEIHASVAMGGTIDKFKFSEPRKIMAALKSNHFGGYVMRCINKHCPGMEWLMSAQDFEDLLLADFYRFLHGQGAVETQKRLKNPKTGNVFHRVALIEAHKMVGGVRVWLTNLDDEAIHIGFRFRLEAQTTESTHVRGQAVTLVESLEEETANIKEYVAKEVVVPALEFETLIG